VNRIDLTNRTAIITGGGSGIGLATARRFLKSGAIVELWGRDTARLEAAIANLPDRSRVTQKSVDVVDEAQVNAAVSAYLAVHGRIDILFNNAGAVQPARPITDVTTEEWRRNFAVNLDSVFYACRAVVPSMVAAGFGRIISTASMAGKDGNAFQAAYAASKAGLIGLTKSLGKELAETGVTVNCVIPALFDTPLASSAVNAAPEVFAEIKNKIPMKRLGRPEEAAAMVAWLASDESSFTTGFGFDLSGGRATY